jgi:hypothetical protein
VGNRQVAQAWQESEQRNASKGIEFCNLFGAERSGCDR